MRSLLRKLWSDDSGAVYSTEIVLVATVLVIGLVSGLKAVNLAVNDELSELATAIGHISQTYSYCGTSGQCASSAGSHWTDAPHNYNVRCDPTYDSDRPGQADPDFACRDR